MDNKRNLCIITYDNFLFQQIVFLIMIFPYVNPAYFCA